jgi:hypothetical protein
MQKYSKAFLHTNGCLAKGFFSFLLHAKMP